MDPRPQPAAFRKRGRAYRAEFADRNFSLGGHLAKTLLVAAAIASFGVWLTRDAAGWHWAVMPAFFVVANGFEWGIHRFLMHRRLWPRTLYRNHAKIHHSAFEDDDQEIDTVHDLSLVMMPWYTLVFVFALASPVAVVAAAAGGSSLAGVFLVSSVVYFLVYETIHTLHHLPRGTLQRLGLGNARWLAHLRRHHHHHHTGRRMTKVNFNVTLPLADLVLGTYEVPPAD